MDRVNGYICQCPESVSGPNCENEQQSEYLSERLSLYN